MVKNSEFQPLKGATKDRQTVSRDGFFVSSSNIDGVRIIEKSNIITGNGITTELFSSNWSEQINPPQHIIQVVLRANTISAWHCHERQEDHIFTIDGTIKVVLYDTRPHSPTKGDVNEFVISFHRPTLLIIPPGVWHGIQSMENKDIRFLNMFNHPYNHENPDEWRLPVDTNEIPYKF